MLFKSAKRDGSAILISFCSVLAALVEVDGAGAFFWKKLPTAGKFCFTPSPLSETEFETKDDEFPEGDINFEA